MKQVGTLSFALAAIVTLLAQPRPANAAENGITFWLPGEFGSMAATPATPGLSWATVYLHEDVSSAAGAAFPRGGRVDVGIGGKDDLALFGPTYVFAQPFLGAQAAMSLLAIAGRAQASASAVLTGPMGGTLAVNRSDSLTSIGDLVPEFTLKWNRGVNNFMVYGTGDIPVGNYAPDRLANLGLGHGAIDAGAGYTYFDPKAGNEFSAVAGFTYNFINTDTQYQSGAVFHVDWGTSHFFTRQLQLGLVGYYLQQISPDTGAGAILGPFESRVAGIGPQIGYLFPVGNMQGYVNLKGYKEFAAENRPDGWNLWLTFAVSPAAPEPGVSPTPAIHK